MGWTSKLLTGVKSWQGLRLLLAVWAPLALPAQLVPLAQLALPALKGLLVLRVRKVFRVTLVRPVPRALQARRVFRVTLVRRGPLVLKVLLVRRALPARKAFRETPALLVLKVPLVRRVLLVLLGLLALTLWMVFF